MLEKVYGALVGGELRREGEELVGRCPFHDDGEHPNLHINPMKDVFHCFACGAGGGVVDFVACLEFKGDGVRAREWLRENGYVTGTRGRDKGVRNARNNATNGLSLAQYAAAKKLTEEFLKDLGVTERCREGERFLRISYFDERGEETAVRFRCALSGNSRFRWKKGSKPLLYGLWRLKDAQKAGRVVIVEGESDCHTLWTWRREWAEHLEDLERVYVLQEPDRAGERLVERIAESGLAGRLFVVTLRDAKDPSELHVSAPRPARTPARGPAADTHAVPPSPVAPLRLILVRAHVHRCAAAAAVNYPRIAVQVLRHARRQSVLFASGTCAHTGRCAAG